MLKGSLQEKNKKYYAVFRISGKQKWVNLNISTQRGNKRKAEQAMRLVLEKYDDSIIRDMLFVDFMNGWLDYIKDIVKPSTYETYLIQVKKVIIPYFVQKNYKISEFTPTIFNEIFKYLKVSGGSKHQGMAKKSVRNIRGILTVAFKYACDNGLLKDNVALKSSLPTFENDIQREPVVYTPEQVVKLLNTAKENGNHTVYIFLMLALHTGMRRGELLALTWDDIDFDKKTLSVNKNRTGTYKSVTELVTTPKTSSSNRIIPITESLLKALNSEKILQQEELIFSCSLKDEQYNFVIKNKLGQPYSNLSAINRIIYRLEKEANLPHCTVHGLRHTVANILDSNGVPIQDIAKILGHESTKTTERIYIHRNCIIKRESVELLDGLYV